MIAPLFLNFEQFSRVHGIPDPGADHGMLGASGHMSARSRTSLLAQRDEQFHQHAAGLIAYQWLLDQGLLVDPTGRFTAYTWTQELAHRERQAQALIANAEQLEDFVASGYRPRVHAQLARAKRAQAAAILKGE